MPLSGGFIEGWSLATPVALLLILPAAYLFASQLRPERAAFVVADVGPLAAAARPTWRTRGRRLPDVLRGVAILLLVLAVARPREGLAVTSLPEEGIDVVAVVDVSTSMRQALSRDESLMEAARRVLAEFADTMEGNRLGLVLFQSRALALSPLTSDLNAIHARIDQLEPGLVPDGTAIGLGIMEGLALLRESPARSRVVVLLTDGRNNSGEVSPMESVRVAEALEVRVYTIGLISPGSFGFESVDSAALTEMAEVTGGSYFDARTAEELSAAYEEIGALERSRLGERRFVAYRELGPWLALAAAGLLLVDGGLRMTLLRRQP